MTYLVILTMQKQNNSEGGIDVGTVNYTLNVQRGASRAALLEHAKKQMPDVFHDANVMFFYAEPDELR